MPRDGTRARAALRQAALELFEEVGYEAVTAAVIAARAGVTERTFFRHFADKREALFDGEQALFDVMTAAVAVAPAGTTPLALVTAAYTAAVPLVMAGRSEARRRASIVAMSPALQERAHAKAAALTRELVAALLARGVDERTAQLATAVGAAAFERALRDWDANPSSPLDVLIARVTDEVRQLW